MGITSSSSVNASDDQFTNSVYWSDLGDGLSSGGCVQVEGNTFTKQECMVMALEMDRGNSKAWRGLGRCVAPKRAVLVGQEAFTDLQCFLKAVEVDPLNSSAWFDLGLSLPKGGATKKVFSTNKEAICNKSYSKQQCYVRALELDPTHAKAWESLGEISSDEVEMVVGGKAVTRQECFANSLGLEKGNSVGWVHISTLVPHGGEVVVAGQSYTFSQCCVNVLENDPRNFAIWHALGMSLPDTASISVSDSLVVNWKCHVHALEIDLTTPDVWVALGNTMPEGIDMSVSGQMYSKQGCYLKAIALAPTSFKAWHCIARGLPSRTATVDIGGTLHTKSSCFAQVLEIEPRHNSEAWCEFGASLIPGAEGYFVDSYCYDYSTRKSCFEKAVQSDQKNAAAWLGLGNAEPQRMALWLLSKNTTVKDCFVKAVELDPTTLPCAWYSLGSVTPANGSTEIKGVRYTRQECFDKFRQLSTTTTTDVSLHVRVLEMDPSNGYAWFHLGNEIRPNGTVVSVSGETFTKQQCYVNTLNIDPLNPPAWQYLADTMLSVEVAASTATAHNNATSTNDEKGGGLEVGENTEPAKVTMCDKSYTRLECIAKVPESWQKLSQILRGDETVVDGELHSDISCLEKMLEANCGSAKSWQSAGLALKLKKSASISVHGTQYTSMQCFIKVVEFNPRGKDHWFTTAWKSLSVKIKGEVVVLEGKEMTREECIVELHKIHDVDLQQQHTPPQ